MGVDPVGNGLDLRQILAVVDQLVQPDELSGGFQREVIHQKARHRHNGQRRAAHRDGKHQRKHPVEKLEIPVLLDALGQRGRAGEEEQQPPRHKQQHLVRAGVLHPDKQQKAGKQLCARKAGQGGQAALCRKPQPQPDEDKVQQSDAQSLCGQLQRKAAEVVVGVAPGVVEAKNFAHHRPQQNEHSHHAHQPEQHQIAHLHKRLRFLPSAGGAHAAYQHQRRVGKVVAHHKV